MLRFCRTAFLIAPVVVLCSLFAIGQDSPPLGDVARQARQKKLEKQNQNQGATNQGAPDQAVPGPATPEQSAQAAPDSGSQAPQDKSGPAAVSPRVTSGISPKRVITDDDISGHSESIASAPAAGGNDHAAANPAPSSGGAKLPAEQWKAQIRAQKDAINTLQSNIDKVQDSIQYAPSNCVSGCAQWNEAQQKKQQEVDRARSQLEALKQKLQEMQESARQQGYGSSVYDP